MYAIIRENTFDPTKVAQAGAQLAEFQDLHSRQAGYAGTIVIDAGEGRQLAINLWQTEEDASAALPAMVPVVRRVIEPLMAAQSRLVAAGPVALTDLTTGTA